MGYLVNSLIFVYYIMGINYPPLPRWERVGVRGNIHGCIFTHDDTKRQWHPPSHHFAPLVFWNRRSGSLRLSICRFPNSNKTELLAGLTPQPYGPGLWKFSLQQSFRLCRQSAPHQPGTSHGVRFPQTEGHRRDPSISERTL